MRQRKEPERAPAAVHGSERAGPAEDLAVSNDSARAGHVAVEPVDGVRDAALPLIEAAHLAIHIAPRPADEHARLLGALERSALPSDRVAALTGRLTEQQDLAGEISSAVERWFGADTPETRALLSDALTAIAGAMAAGRSEAEGFTLGDRTLPWAASDASGRAEALVPALGREVAGLAPPVAERLGGFCREVQLLALFDEDEEEGLLADYAAEEHG